MWSFILQKVLEAVALVRHVRLCQCLSGAFFELVPLLHVGEGHLFSTLATALRGRVLVSYISRCFAHRRLFQGPRHSTIIMRSSSFSPVALSLAALVAPSAAFWRMACPGHIVVERADPIVFPGDVASHVHTISGGNGFSLDMDYEDARSATCSSCPITQDLSNYWTPKLYYQAEDGTFIDVPQSGDGDGVYGGMAVYYLYVHSDGASWNS